MGGKQDVNKEPGRALAAFTGEVAGASRQPRQLQFQQLQAALSGDPSAQRDVIPSLDQALNTLEVGRSTALRDTRERLNKSGIPGGFQAAEIFEVDQTGRIVEGETRDTILRQLIGEAPTSAVSLAQQAARGLQSGAARAGQTEQANEANKQSTTAAAGSAAGAIVGGVIIAL